eukprot:scaffold361305_cov149-Cyclotella_meneghiniana.AAC.1
MNCPTQNKSLLGTTRPPDIRPKPRGSRQLMRDFLPHGQCSLRKQCGNTIPNRMRQRKATCEELNQESDQQKNKCKNQKR